jgi:hypothetical protein
MPGLFYISCHPPLRENRADVLFKALNIEHIIPGFSFTASPPKKRKLVGSMVQDMYIVKE